MSEATLATARALRDAITNNDMDKLHELFDDSISVRYNTNPETLDKASTISNISSLRGASSAVAYRNVRIDEIADGYVQQATLQVTTASGATRALELCLVARLGSSGKIVRMDEYMDSAQVGATLAE